MTEDLSHPPTPSNTRIPRQERRAPATGPTPILSKFQTPATRTIGWASLTALAICAYSLTAGRIVLNGSDSLKGGAFYILAAPKILARGAVVAFDPPQSMRGAFDGLVFVKRIWGLPGDRIAIRNGMPCIDDQCFELAQREGALARPIAAVTIPRGYIAVIGETPTSLDSRYAAIGLIPVTDVIGTGFALPYIGDWTVLDRWVRL